MKRFGVMALGALLAGCTSSQPKVEPSTKPAATFKVDPSTAGVIAGKVTFGGKRPAARRIDISEDEECVKLNRSGLYDESIVVNRNGSLANVFVYIKSGLEGKSFEPPVEPVVLHQRGCRFAPRVLGIRTGQTFQVTNSDPVTHNVHPVAKMNREWNQSQAPGDPPLQRRFVRPEVLIRIKCNVHNWMRSWVAAMEHPYFAVTGADGSFTMANVPPGDYTIEAWQEVLGAQEQRVHIARAGKVDLAFHFKAESGTR